MSPLLSGALLVLVATFLVAAGHKIAVARTPAARDEPLLRLTAYRRRHARSLLTIVGAAEVVLVVLLLVAPVAGLACAVAVLLLYTAGLRGLEPGEPCNCLGDLGVERTRRDAYVRNAVLLLLALCALVAEARDAGIAAPSAEGGAVAALLLAAPVALRLLRGPLVPSSTQPEVPS